MGIVLPHPSLPTMTTLEVKKKEQFRAAVITDYRCVDYSILPQGVQYIAWGLETCPKTGRLHFQAFAYGEKSTLSGWSKKFGKSHVEKMLGSFVQNDVYCSKQSQLQELGLRPMGDGQKRTLKDFTDEIIRRPGVAPVDIALDQAEFAPVFCQFRGGLNVLAAARFARSIKGDHSAPTVTFVHGPSGAGKTRYVRELEPDCYTVPSGLQWFDGYFGHEAVLLNNLSPSSLGDRDRFLEILDRYPIQVPIKGGFVMWKPRRIYITSTYSLEMFTMMCHQPTELTRRITTVMNLPTI